MPPRTRGATSRKRKNTSGGNQRSSRGGSGDETERPNASSAASSRERDNENALTLPSRRSVPSVQQGFRPVGAGRRRDDTGPSIQPRSPNDPAKFIARKHDIGTDIDQVS